jgi:hypothetical protein
MVTKSDPGNKYKCSGVLIARFSLSFGSESRKHVNPYSCARLAPVNSHRGLRDLEMAEAFPDPKEILFAEYAPAFRLEIDST